MKNKLIILTIILLLISAGIWWYQNQSSVNYCKDKCIYISSREPEPSGALSLLGKGDYWSYKGRKFEEQEQCIDYCLRNK